MQFNGFHCEPTGQLSFLSEELECDFSSGRLFSELLQEIEKEYSRLQAYALHLRTERSQIINELSNCRRKLDPNADPFGSTFPSQLTAPPEEASNNSEICALQSPNSGNQEQRENSIKCTKWEKLVKEALGAHMNHGEHMIKECWKMSVEVTVAVITEAEDESLSDMADEQSPSASASFFDDLMNGRSIFFGDGALSPGSEKAGRSKPMFLIRPDSRLGRGWTLASLFILFYELVMISTNVFEEQRYSFPLNRMQWIILGFWSLDIFLRLCFIDSYVDGQLCSNRLKIAQVYAKSWLVFDLVCTIPPWIVQVGINSQVEFMRAFRWIRLLQYIRLLRLLKFQTLSSFSDSMLGPIAHMTEELLLISFWIHVSACIWFILGGISDKGWVALMDIKADSPIYKYSVSVQWAAAQLQGGTDVFPGYTVVERSYAAFAIFLSIIILARFIGGLTSTMLEWQSVRLRNSRWHELERKFAQDGLAYPFIMLVRYHLKVSRSAQELKNIYNECAEALQLLPKDIRREVLHEWRRNISSVSVVISAIQHIHERCFERLCCDAFQMEQTLHDEHVFAYMQLGSCMYIVAEGTLHYHLYNHLMHNTLVQGNPTSLHSSCSLDGESHGKGSKQMANGFTNSLRDRGMAPEIVGVGAVVSEAVLWTYWSHPGDWINARPSCLITLRFGDFLNIVSAYSKPHKILAKHAEHFTKKLNEAPLERKSDLFHSGKTYKAFHKA